MQRTNHEDATRLHCALSLSFSHESEGRKEFYLYLSRRKRSVLCERECVRRCFLRLGDVEAERFTFNCGATGRFLCDSARERVGDDASTASSLGGYPDCDTNEKPFESESSRGWLTE